MDRVDGVPPADTQDENWGLLWEQGATDGCVSAPLLGRHPRGRSLSVMLQNGSWLCNTCSEMQPECDLGIGKLSSHPRRLCCVSRQVTPEALCPWHCLLTGNRSSSLGLGGGCPDLTCLGSASELRGTPTYTPGHRPPSAGTFLQNTCWVFVPCLRQAHLSTEPRLHYFL